LREIFSAELSAEWSKSSKSQRAEILQWQAQWRQRHMETHFLALDSQAGVDEPGGGAEGEEQEVGELKSILSKFDEIAQNFAKKFGI